MVRWLAAGGDMAEDVKRYWTIARVVVAALAIVAIVSVAMLVGKLAGVLMMVFAAVVLAVVFDALARLLCRTGLGRGLALAASVILLLLLFTLVLVLFGTQIAGELDTIKDSIPRALDSVRSFLASVGMDGALSQALNEGSSDLQGFLGKAGGFAMATGNTVANVALVVAGAVFLAADPSTYRRGLILLVPKSAEDTATDALDDATRGLRGWMMGQAVSSVVVAVLTWAGLALLGVPAAGGLGLVAGMFDVIPMVGPVIAGVPAVLLAFTDSPQTALWTIVLFLVVQQIQGNFLQPMIQKEAVNVPPAMLLFAVVGVGTLFGFIGVLLAAPFTIVAFVMVQRIYVKTLLGRDIKIANKE